MKKIIQLAEKWNNLNTDLERWEFLIENKKTFIILLDNDDTGVQYQSSIVPSSCDDLDDLPKLNWFDSWIGNAPGINDLMQTIGLVAEGV